MTSEGAVALAIASGMAVGAGSVRYGASVRRARRTGCAFWDAFAGGWEHEPILGVRAGTLWLAICLVGISAFFAAPPWMATR